MRRSGHACRIRSDERLRGDATRENVFRAQDKVAKIGMFMEAVQKKIAGWEIPENIVENETLNEVDRRYEQQRQADERKVVPQKHVASRNKRRFPGQIRGRAHGVKLHIHRTVSQHLQGNPQTDACWRWQCGCHSRRDEAASH